MYVPKNSHKRVPAAVTALLDLRRPFRSRVRGGWWDDPLTDSTMLCPLLQLCVYPRSHLQEVQIRSHICRFQIGPRGFGPMVLLCQWTDYNLKPTDVADLLGISA